VNESWIIAAALALTAVLLAIGPSDELGFLLQAFGAGTALGTFVAYRAIRRNPSRATFPIQVRWGGFGVTVGLVYMVGEGLFW
jgi:hypothetical protein